MSIHFRSQPGIVATGYEQNSDPHGIDVLHTPPPHTASVSSEHARATSHPTPHTVHAVQLPSRSPAHPLLYCPAGHRVQFVHTPSEFCEHGPRYCPDGHPPDVQPVQGGSAVGVPSQGVEWYLSAEHARQSMQVTTS
jgi:hypothetical protein